MKYFAELVTACLHLCAISVLAYKRLSEKRLFASGDPTPVQPHHCPLLSATSANSGVLRHTRPCVSAPEPDDVLVKLPEHGVVFFFERVPAIDRPTLSAKAWDRAVSLGCVRVGTQKRGWDLLCLP